MRTAVGDTTIVVDNVDVSNNEIQVGDMISFYSDAGNTTPVTGERGREYEVTVVNTSTNVVTFRLKDDPNSAGVQNNRR